MKPTRVAVAMGVVVVPTITMAVLSQFSGFSLFKRETKALDVAVSNPVQSSATATVSAAAPQSAAARKFWSEGVKTLASRTAGSQFADIEAPMPNPIVAEKIAAVLNQGETTVVDAQDLQTGIAILYGADPTEEILTFSDEASPFKPDSAESGEGGLLGAAPTLTEPEAELINEEAEQVFAGALGGDQAAQVALFARETLDTNAGPRGNSEVSAPLSFGYKAPFSADPGSGNRRPPAGGAPFEQITQVAVPAPGSAAIAAIGLAFFMRRRK